MVCRVNPSSPPILRSGMVSRRTRLAWPGKEVLSICSLLNSIVIPEETTTTQLREEEVDDLLEGLRLDYICLNGLSDRSLPQRSVNDLPS